MVRPFVAILTHLVALGLRCRAHVVAFRDATDVDDVLWQQGRDVARQVSLEDPVAPPHTVDVVLGGLAFYYPPAYVAGFRSVFDPVAPSHAFEAGRLDASETFLCDPFTHPRKVMRRYATEQTSFGDGARFQCREEWRTWDREEAAG